MNNKAKMHSLVDNFEIEGQWYLPGQTIDDAIPGTLKYSPESINLYLNGAFSDFLSVTTDGTSKKTKIFGFSHNGEYFSLYGCMLLHSSISYPGYQTDSYYVNKFYAGDFIITDESLAEHFEASFSFCYLDAWLRYSILSRTFSAEHKRTDLTINLDKEENEFRQIPIRSEGITLNEEIGYSIKSPEFNAEEESIKISFHRFYSITSDPDKLYSPEYLFSIIQNYRRLLALLIGAPMYFSYIEYYILGNEITDVHVQQRQRIRLFYSQAGNINKAKKLSPTKPNLILIKRENIKNRLDEIVNNWFDNKEKYNNVLNAFISDSYLPGYIETEFLNCAKGLESYHRFFYDSENTCIAQETDSLLSEEKQRLLDFVSQNISESNQDYFNNRITYEEDTTSFRTRLKVLIDALPVDLQERILGKSDRKTKNSFINHVIDTRNYYTHRDTLEKYKNAVVSIGPLSDTVRQLSAILQFLCLTQIGVDRSIVENALINRF